MAESTRSLLDGIQCGNALEAVNAVRYSSPTFLPQVDQQISQHRPMSSSTLQRGDFVEIVGPSGSGKTSLILFLLLTHLLPFTVDIPLAHGANVRVQLGGKGQAAALLHSLFQQPPIHALARAMRGHVRDCLASIVSAHAGGGGQGGRYAPVTEDGMEGVVRSALARLRVIRVKGRYKSWALAVRSLAFPLKSRAEEQRGGEEVDVQAPSLVCLDGLSKCHWTEKWADEERSSSSTSNSAGGRSTACPPGVTPTDGVGMRDVMQAVGRLRLDMGCVIVCTTQGFWHEKKPGTALPTPFYAPYLPAPFPTPWTIARSATPSSASSHPTRNPSSFAGTSQQDADADDHQADLSNKLRARDPTYWPLTFQLTLTGRERGLQMPSDTMLADALTAREADQRRAGGADTYGGKVRMHGIEGPVGGRAGVGWKFGIGAEGVESYDDA